MRECIQRSFISCCASDSKSFSVSSLLASLVTRQWPCGYSVRPESGRSGVRSLAGSYHRLLTHRLREHKKTHKTSLAATARRQKVPLFDCLARYSDVRHDSSIHASQLVWHRGLCETGGLSHLSHRMPVTDLRMMSVYVISYYKH